MHKSNSYFEISETFFKKMKNEKRKPVKTEETQDGNQDFKGKTPYERGLQKDPCFVLNLSASEAQNCLPTFGVRILHNFQFSHKKYYVNNRTEEYEVLCTGTSVHKPVQSVHNYRKINGSARNAEC